MASTSTNKQPLLVDQVLHYVINLDTSINNGLDIIGTNTATLIVDAIGTDGGSIGFAVKEKNIIELINQPPYIFANTIYEVFIGVGCYTMAGPQSQPFILYSPLPIEINTTLVLTPPDL